MADTATLAEPTPASSSTPHGSIGVQLVVVALLVAATIVGGFVLPAWAQSVTTGDGGERVGFDGAGSFVPAAGWKRATNTDQVIAYERAGATLAVDRAVPSTASVDEAIAEATEFLAEIASWQLEDPVELRTASGVPAAEVTAHRGDQVWVVFAVADGESTMQASVIAPEAVWSEVRDDIEEMVMSIELPEAEP